ncbi:hypothetical protein J6590_048533 [Homalodisca vitripennis]|nr:hypothetical protein J6590_048533 [Homalodisca vitripennis]
MPNVTNDKHTGQHPVTLRQRLNQPSLWHRRHPPSPLHSTPPYPLLHLPHRQPPRPPPTTTHP